MNEPKPPIIHGAEGRVYAYQEEAVRISARISATESNRPDRDKYLPWDESHHMELEINHGSRCVEVRLKIEPTSHEFIERRNTKGAGLKHTLYIASMGFGEFVNRIFGLSYQIFEEEEALPDRVKAAMKGAYDAPERKNREGS